MATWGSTLNNATYILAEAGVPSPRVDALHLAEYYLGTKPHPGETITSSQATDYLALIGRRATREPLQHITGRMYFRYLELESSPDAFIVRPETELVAGAAIEAAHHMLRTPHTEGDASLTVVDLCTGSGAIALAVATEVPGTRVYGVEISDKAYRVAEKNNARYGNVAHFQCADAITALPEWDGTVDIVVTNPPYVPPGVEHSPEVQADPHNALWGGGEDGLELPKKLVARAARLLRPGGVLIMEHAENQGEHLREYMKTYGFSRVETHKDYTHRPRWTQGQLASLEQAAQAIQRGELIVLPTDTVYGLGANPRDPEAVTRLLTAKNRGRDKPSPVLVASLEQARSLATHIPEAAQKMAEDLWPGALTIVLPARQEMGWDLGETGGTVALRMPDHPVALRLLEHTGPLAVTSANLTGHAPATTAAQAREQLGDKVAEYIDAGLAPGGIPSTIVEFPGENTCHILRHGAIKPEIIEKYGKLV